MGCNGFCDVGCGGATKSSEVDKYSIRTIGEIIQTSLRVNIDMTVKGGRDLHRQTHRQ